MNVPFYVRQMIRESRGSRGRLTFFVLCLAVGVAAVVAVAGLSDGFDAGIRREARKLLAADIVVESRRPLPPALDEVLAGFPPEDRTGIKEMATVVSVPIGPAGPGPSRLVELKVVDGDYPFYGDLELEPDRPLGELLGDRGAVVAPELLAHLGLDVGDTLRIGGRDFEITGRVLGEPDRMNLSLSLGPRVFVAESGFAHTGLEGLGSLIRYRALVRVPAAGGVAEVNAVARQVRAALKQQEFVRVETYAQAQPGLRRGFRRVSHYLGLVALLSLLIGGVGVAQVVRAWLAGRTEAIAILKCLGLRPVEVLALYLGQTALLGIVGAVVGVAVGAFILWLLPGLLGDVLPAGLSRPWQPAAFVRGLLLGAGIAVLFSLPPLLGVLRVPPARVLRHDAEPLPGNRPAWWGTAAALLGGTLLTATIQSGSLVLGAQFVGGLVVLVGALALATLLLTRAAARLSRDRAGFWLRHGLAALVRPGASTPGAVVALGLGVLVVLAMYLVQDGLGDQLGSDLPRNAPTAFLVDIQQHQWDGVRDLLEREGASSVDSVPVVMARLRAIDGKPVGRILEDGPPDRSRRWVFTREQRLTYLDRLPRDNRLVEGALWSDPGRDEVSVEQDFARDLGVGLGSVLTFDVQGVPLDLAVTSVRSVEWRTFGINFFLVVEPGVLDEAPQFRVATARIPREREQPVQDAVAARFPNVTVLKVREILEKVASLLDRLGFGVRLLGGFTVLAGVIILAGAVSAGAVRRGREVALLKTLGLTRLGVVALFSIEYALVGLVAGTIGAIGAGVLAWAVLARAMEVPFGFEPSAYFAAIGGSVLLTVAAGSAASVRALSRKPIEVLREE